MRRIAVIGAGWAGLAAALTLQRQGHHVTVYERSPAHQGAGGRASTAYAAGERAPFAIDNGQHVLLGAYSATLALFESLDIHVEQVFLRLPAAWIVPQHLNIAIPQWSDSAGFAGILKQMPIAMALFKASNVKQWPALLAAAVRLQWLAPAPNETVTDWLKRLEFPTIFNEQLWLPLCYATLNTPPSSASAAVFKRVIQDGLLAGSQAAAMLVPRTDLGSLLPKPALATLGRAGATLKLGAAVNGVELNGSTVLVHGEHETNPYDGLICATSAKDAARILPEPCIHAALRALAAHAPEPISTVHLNLGMDFRLPQAVCVLPEPHDASNPISHAVAIDRSALDAAQTGWVTVVLSCSAAALGHSHEALIQGALERLIACFPSLSFPSQCSGVVIHAKQATFACTAGLARPPATTASPLIVLAGDYVAGDYPATLEGAVRSGVSAAALI